jgi:DNA invertase Pin-like site-specific DNA recombinase
MQCKMVSYMRVSTDEQGRSGLGLEGQEAAVATHVARHGCDLIARYVEIETGKRDTLDNRPQLRKAIAHAKRSKATLVVAKLDRLTRSVAVLSLLQQAGIDFIACDNPQANRMTVTILVAVAENEVAQISERTKAALAAYKARGGVLGAARPDGNTFTQEAREKGAARAGEVVRAKALEAYVDLLPAIRDFKKQGLSLRAIAARLNVAGQTTRSGKPWNAMQVSRVLGMAD